MVQLKILGVRVHSSYKLETCNLNFYVNGGMFLNKSRNLKYVF